MNQDQLSINLTHADGFVTRLGPDETDAANIPQDLSFSTSLPGGFKDATLGLLRRIDKDWPDLDPFDNVRIIGPGGRVAWEGRQSQFPRSHSDSYGITPGAVGWSAHLLDNPSFTAVIVDRDPSHWQDILLERKIQFATGTISLGDFSFATGGEIACAFPNQALGTKTAAETMYLGPAGTKISRVQYRGVFGGVPVGYTVSFFASDSTTVPTDSYSPNLDDTVRQITLTTNRQHMFLLIYSSGTAATPAAGSLLRVSKIAVIGDHGLTPVTTVSGEPDGFTASDIVAYTVAKAAPLLDARYMSLGGLVEPTTFPIPHAAYRDPTTAEAVISDVNKYHLYDWGVWENRQFFFRRPDPDRLCWEARLGDGAHMQADGLTGEQVINGVFVTYTDASGVTKTVGPPGGSFDDTSSTLADSSDVNPVNSHGIPAKWDNLTLSFPATLAAAIQIGAVYLAERSLATRRGSLTLTGTVQHPTEGDVPVWRVRAGDWIRIADLNGENANVQRKIINTSYSHGSRQITLELDNTPAKLSAILERVGIGIIQAGGGF